MVKYLVLISLFFFSSDLWAQDSVNQVPPPAVDSNPPVVRRTVPRRVIPKPDTTVVRDTLPATRPFRPVVVSPFVLKDSFVYASHPYFRFTNPVRYAITRKQWEGKEVIFYSILGLLIFFALIRNGFQRYIDDLFKIFFRTTVKQRQIREQLMESPLPSMLLNIFFLLSTGMFLALMLHYFKLGLQYNLYILFAYCALGLLAIYGTKFITLKFLGWIFQVSDAIDAYVFIVFSTNKVIGISLLPFIVVLAFTTGFISEAAMSLSLVLVLGLLAYRFFLSYMSIHRQVKISLFHFFLYLLAFELAPLLLINKLLFSFLGETY